MPAKKNHYRDRYTLNSDWQDSLILNQIDPAQLSQFQRVLLITDGTLTEILEAYLFEKIEVIKLAEHLTPSVGNNSFLEILIGQELLTRKILLQGKKSKQNWVYAESIIVPERLEKKFIERLITSHTPIGKLWLEYKIEVFKEMMSLSRESAGDLSRYFQITPQDFLLSRTYRVFSNRQPIMMITEKFPETYFTLIPDSLQNNSPGFS
jgi:chorismate-pyruvate lyase